MRKELLLCCVFGIAFAQGPPTQIDLRTQSKSIDFSAANTTKPVKTGTTLPASCSPGEMFYLLNAPEGSNLYGCTATNIWTPQGGSDLAGDVTGPASGTVVTQIQGRPVSSGVPGAGQALVWNNANNDWEPETIGSGGSGATMLQQMGDWWPSIADPTTRKTVAINGLSTMVSCGSAQYPGPGGVSITLNAGSAAPGSMFWIYFDCTAGVMKVDANSSANLTNVTSAGITRGSNSASGFPANSIQIATVRAGTSAADTFDAGGVTDCRTAFRQPVLNSGGGIDLTNNANGSQTLAFDAASAQYQAPWNGASPTTMQAKLARMDFDVCSDFGARCDFSTDDTAAVQAAINAACAISPAGRPVTVTLNNNRISSALNYNACTTGKFLQLHIVGRISLGAPLLVGPISGTTGIVIRLTGEGEYGTQFVKGAVANIYCDRGAVWTNTISGSSTLGQPINACLIVGGDGANGTYVNRVNAQGSNGYEIWMVPRSSLVTMDSVGAIANRVATSVPLQMDAVEWITIRDSAFNTLPGASPCPVHLTSTTQSYGPGEFVMEHTVLAGGGFCVDNTGPGGGDIATFTLNDVTTEQVVDSLITSRNTGIGGIRIAGSSMADGSLGAGTLTVTSSVSAGGTSMAFSDVTQYYSTFLVGNLTVTAAAPIWLQSTRTKEYISCYSLSASAPVQGSPDPGTMTCSPTANAYNAGDSFVPQPRAIRQTDWSRTTQYNIQNVTFDDSCVFPVADFNILSLHIVHPGCGQAGQMTDLFLQNQRNYIVENYGGIDAVPANTGANAFVMAPFLSLNIPQAPPAWGTVSGTGPAWQPNTTYSSTNQYVTDKANHNQQLTGVCTSSAGAPTWNTVLGGVTTDNNCTWAYSSGGGGAPWAASHVYPPNSYIVDSNGHSQHLTTNLISGAAAPAWNDTGGTTVDNTGQWTDLGPASTLTTSTMDPFGIPDAGTITCNGYAPPICNVSLTANQLTHPGDWIIFGSWARSETPGQSLLGMASYTNLQLSGSGVFDNAGSQVSASSYLTEMSANNGRWSRFTAAVKVTAGATSMTLQLAANPPNDPSISYYKPFIVYVPASSGYSDQEVIRLSRNTGNYVSNLPAASGGPRLLTYPETSLCWGATCITQSNGIFALPPTTFTAGATIASAATIAPTNQIQDVSGSAAISTITVPAGFSSGCLKLIPTGAWATTTSGNIANAITATVNIPVDACYNALDYKWYLK